MRVEVLGGVERRRRWSHDDKMRMIEETLAPGAVVTEIARRHGIATSLLFTWRRRARLATVASAGPRLVPVQLTPAAAESGRSIEAPVAMPPRKRRGLIPPYRNTLRQTGSELLGLCLSHRRSCMVDLMSPDPSVLILKSASF